MQPVGSFVFITVMRSYVYLVRTPEGEDSLEKYHKVTKVKRNNRILKEIKPTNCSGLKFEQKNKNTRATATFKWCKLII